MNDLLNAILGLEGLRFGDEGARLGWAHPLPAWGWLLITLASLAVAMWSYSRLEGSRPVRLTLAIVRTVLLLLIAIAAAGPRLERERTEVEQDRVIVLVDRSASLSISDAPGRTRDDDLRQLLAESSAVWASLAEDKDLVWLGFDSGASPLQTTPDGLAADLPPAAGVRTAIGSAIDEALRRAAGSPLSGIVLISDGRSADGIGNDALRALLADRVPVHVVPLGSAEPAADLAVVSAEAPAVAFVDDTVPVTVRFETHGLDPAHAGMIEIIDESTGLTLRSRPVTPDELGRGHATLSPKAQTAGEQRWTVRYVPSGPDLAPGNNTASVAVRFVDDPIRVLYVDGSPRWENRYLKSLLLREDSIDSSCLLLAVNRRFQQEGDTVLATLPQGPREWSGFDVIIIGDIRPELIGMRALEDIRAQVGDQAAGLLWLAGPTATPAQWGRTPLTDLLPLSTTADDSGRHPAIWDRPVVLRPTALAERTGVFANLHASGGIADPDAGWSALRWAVRIEPDTLKASAETLATAHPVTGDASSAAPLVVSMRYGAGRVVFVGTDEIWRWRYGRGEPPTERFWLPLIRSLARPRLAGIGAPASLELTPSITELGGRVSATLTINDQSIAEIAPMRIIADVRTNRSPTDNADGPTVATIQLTREPRVASGRTVYTGSTPALQPGSFRVVIPPDALAGVRVAAGLEVISPDDELRNPQADHHFLADLAERTGGRSLGPGDLATLPELLPNRKVIVPLSPESTALWDTPLALAIFVLLLTTEWASRRAIRLA